MKLKLKVTRHTTVEELRALGVMFIAFAAKQNHVFSPPTDPAELHEPETTVVVSASDPLGQLTGSFSGIPEVPKLGRKRRTKEEIAAAAAGLAADAAAGGAEPSPEVTPEPAPLVEALAPIPDATATTTTAAEPAASTPATESPSDREYSEVEVQDLAGKVARTVGPEVVKGKIAELGAARIAELTTQQRNALGAFLTSQLP